MNTPFPAATQGLVEALRACGRACAGAADIAEADDAAGIRPRVEPLEEALGAIARAAAPALAAWESRRRARDTYEVIVALDEFLAGRLTTSKAADAIEAALLGERGPASADARP